MTTDAPSPLVPKLRFPEFQNAPEWKKSSLGSEAEFFKGRGISKAEIDPQGKRACIRYGELYTRYGEVIHTVHSRTSAPESSLFLSRRNDVIVPASGETKEDIATVSCVMLDGVALGSDLNVIRTAHNGVFLSYLLNGRKRREIAKVAQGDTVVHLYPSQLEQVTIALPTPMEQQKIADCLGSLDDLIVAEGRKLEALRQHKQGLMQQLFPQPGETRPRLRFPEFKDAPDWEERKISSILVKKAKAVILDDDGVYQEIGVRSHGRGLFHKDPTTGKAIGAKRVFHVVPGALVINIVFAWEQALAVTTHDEDGFIASHRFPMFLPKSKRCDVRFIQRLFLMPVGKQLLKLASPGGAGRNRTLSQKDFQNLDVLIPGSAEQQCIADCLDGLDAWLALQVQKLAILKTHKQGLLQQVFPSPKDVEA